MIGLRALSSAALVALLSAPAAATAQLGFSVACTPGIPSCGSLRFTFTNAGPDLEFNALDFSLLTPGWTFATAGPSTIGTYAAEDSYGPFSGFTALGSAGTLSAIDFTDNGFPFSLLAAGTGYIDLEATGGTDARGLGVAFTGVTTTGAPLSGSTVPEPATVWLFGAGVAGVAFMARRRTRRAVAVASAI